MQMGHAGAGKANLKLQAKREQGPGMILSRRNAGRSTGRLQAARERTYGRILPIWLRTGLEKAAWHFLCLAATQRLLQHFKVLL